MQDPVCPHPFKILSLLRLQRYKVGAVVLVLVLVDTVCVGGERFVGGVVAL